MKDNGPNNSTSYHVASENNDNECDANEVCRCENAKGGRQSTWDEAALELKVTRAKATRRLAATTQAMAVFCEGAFISRADPKVTSFIYENVGC